MSMTDDLFLSEELYSKNLKGLRKVANFVEL